MKLHGYTSTETARLCQIYLGADAVRIERGNIWADDKIVSIATFHDLEHWSKAHGAQTLYIGGLV